MTTCDKLRYAQHLMADQSRSIPTICRELGSLPASTLYHYLHADGSLKASGCERPGMAKRVPGAHAPAPEAGDVVPTRTRRVRTVA